MLGRGRMPGKGRGAPDCTFRPRPSRIDPHHESEPMASDPILIKRYENRRLYDTDSSRYVNLEDLSRMVRGGQDFEVVDVKSGEDQTRRVLIQIILEEAKREEGGPPIDFLRQMITASDRSVRDFLRWYLGQAMDVYQRFQGVLQGGSFPGGVLQDIPGQLDALTRKWAPGGLAGAWPFGADPRDPEIDSSGETSTGEASTGEASTGEASTGEAEEEAAATATGDLAREMAREMAELRRRMEEMEDRLAADRRGDDELESGRGAETRRR